MGKHLIYHSQKFLSPILFVSLVFLSACAPQTVSVPTTEVAATPTAQLTATDEANTGAEEVEEVETEEAEVQEVATEEAITEETEAEPNEEAVVEAAPLECEEGYRYYNHEAIIAPVCIPEVPERVITLEPFYALQMAVQLKLPVIATGGNNSGIESFPTALTKEETEGISFVGTINEPNLEAIALQTPDLIVGDAYNHTDRYDLLNEIAPTVLINTADWKTWLTILGDIGGVPEHATTALDEYHARVDEIKGKIKEGTVSFVRIQPDHFQLYREAPDSYAPVAIMTEVGVVRTDFEIGTNENSWERLDWEGVLNLTGDTLLYVITGDAETSGQLEEVTINNPLWQTLPAVQAGQAYRVNAEQWMIFGGLRSAHAVLDDIETYLTEE